jgi:hypothetical protein
MPVHSLNTYYARGARSSAGQNVSRACTKMKRRLFEVTDTPNHRRSASRSRPLLTRNSFDGSHRRLIANYHRHSGPSIADRKTAIPSFGIRLCPSRPGVTDRNPCIRTLGGSHSLPITR